MARAFRIFLVVSVAVRAQRSSGRSAAAGGSGSPESPQIPRLRAQAPLCRPCPPLNPPQPGPRTSSPRRQRGAMRTRRALPAVAVLSPPPYQRLQAVVQLQLGAREAAERLLHGGREAVADAAAGERAVSGAGGQRHPRPLGAGLGHGRHRHGAPAPPPRRLI